MQTNSQSTSEPAVAPIALEDVARSVWNQMADEFNQWDSLSQEERDYWLSVVNDGWKRAKDSMPRIPPKFGENTKDEDVFWDSGYAFFISSNSSMIPHHRSK